MEQIANLVTLGGIIALVALGAWAMGRSQGASGLLCEHCDARPTRGCAASWDLVDTPLPGAPVVAELLTPWAHDPCTELLNGPEGLVSLGDLHAEVSAFRRRERVFATLGPVASALGPAHERTSGRSAPVQPIIGRMKSGSGEAGAAPSHTDQPDINAASQAARVLRADCVSLRRAYRP